MLSSRFSKNGSLFELGAELCRAGESEESEFGMGNRLIGFAGTALNGFVFWNWTRSSFGVWTRKWTELSLEVCRVNWTCWNWSHVEWTLEVSVGISISEWLSFGDRFWLWVWKVLCELFSYLNCLSFWMLVLFSGLSSERLRFLSLLCFFQFLRFGFQTWATGKPELLFILTLKIWVRSSLGRAL